MVTIDDVVSAASKLSYTRARLAEETDLRDDIARRLAKHEAQIAEYETELKQREDILRLAAAELGSATT